MGAQHNNQLQQCNNQLQQPTTATVLTATTKESRVNKQLVHTNQQNNSKIAASWTANTNKQTQTKQ
eukprot:11663097-Ditylum_brightwellii.AAC.1